MKTNHYKKTIEQLIFEEGFFILHTDTDFTTFAKHRPALKDQTSDIITLNAKALASKVGQLDIKGSCSLTAATIFEGSKLQLENSVIKLRRVHSFGEITADHSQLDIDRVEISKFNLNIKDSSATLSSINSTSDHFPLCISMSNCRLPAASINSNSHYLYIKNLACYASGGSSIIFEHSFWKKGAELNLGSFHLGSDKPLRWTKASIITRIKNLTGSKITAASLFDQKNKPYIVAGCWEGPLKHFKRLIASPISEWPSYDQFLDDEEQSTNADGIAARERYKTFIKKVKASIAKNHPTT